MGKKPRVGVLMGGRSAERTVSLASGKNVAQALKTKDFSVAEIEIDEDGRWLASCEGGEASDMVCLEPSNLQAAGKKIDVVFIALHGPLGEDGTVQGLFEMLDVPYTGSGVLASALAMNKILTKKVLVQENIPTAQFTAISKQEWSRDSTGIAKRAVKELGLPLVIKPCDQGSSIGVSIIEDEKEFAGAAREAFLYGEMLLVEECLDGREIQCGILGNDELVALPLVEIVSKNNFFDYEAKYDPALAEEIVPAPMDALKAKEIQELSLKVFEAFGCRGFARVDTFLLEDGKIFLSEVNTIPGLTEASLFPKEARAAGIEFPQLVEKLVEYALEK